MRLTSMTVTSSAIQPFPGGYGTSWTGRPQPLECLLEAELRLTAGNPEGVAWPSKRFRELRRRRLEGTSLRNFYVRRRSCDLKGTRDAMLGEYCPGLSLCPEP